MDFTQRAADAASLEINNLLSPQIDNAIAEAAKLEYAATRGSGQGDMAKNRIGAGYIGVACERELGFRYHRAAVEVREGSVTPGELHRHAEAGHWTEAMTARWFAKAGVIVRTTMVDAYGYAVKDEYGNPKQIGWMDAPDPVTKQYRMAGQVDGVIISVAHERLRQLLAPPCVWESKKATDKKWKKFQKEGVKGADPKYFGQLQTNMGYLGITQTLFSMLNLDSMKFYFELIPFDQVYAQRLVNRAVGVFGTQSPYELPRLGRSEDDFVCKFCDFQNQCWHPDQPTQAYGTSVGGFNPNSYDEVPF